MRVVGVDLASQDARSALVELELVELARAELEPVELARAELEPTELEPRDGTVRVTRVLNGCSDAQILAASATAQVIGIDSPLGWPEAFVDFVRRQQDGDLSAEEPMDRNAKARLAFRRTDEAVLATGAGRPLSVSTGFLAYVAMRAASLQAQLVAAGVPVDRSGRTGRVIEVYPAASLRRWGLRQQGYRQGGSALGAAADRLLAAAPWLDVGPHRTVIEGSVDCFDALVAALTALAHGNGRTDPAPDGEIYRREGWILLPSADFLATHPLRPTHPQRPGDPQRPTHPQRPTDHQVS
ncbi:DUF429 domain-containing protein [Nakamurella silvestris]|nr:DUF429 domain-containing protein [Nakamurella silvestris]